MLYVRRFVMLISTPYEMIEKHLLYKSLGNHLFYLTEILRVLEEIKEAGE